LRCSELYEHDVGYEWAPVISRDGEVWYEEAVQKRWHLPTNVMVEIVETSDASTATACPSEAP